jgi:hypothetical protein
MSEQRPLSKVLAHLEKLGLRPVGKNGTWQAFCPGHYDGRRRGLSIREAPDGRVLLHCFHGRPTEEILTALGLSWGDLFPPADRRNGQHGQRQQDKKVNDPLGWWGERCNLPRGWLERLPIEAGGNHIRFRFGNLPIAKARAPGSKGFWLVRDAETGEWRPKAPDDDAQVPPFWPLLPDRVPPIAVLTEGEGDACAALYAIEGASLVEKATVISVTQGAKQEPTPEAIDALIRRGCRGLLVIPDVDQAGRDFARRWAEAARQRGLAVAVLDLLAEGLADPLRGEKDLRDAHRRQALRTMAALREVIEGLVAQTGAQEGEILSAHNKGGSWAERIFLPASQLLAQPQATTNWVLPGYLLKGGVTLLSSRPKIGKTTLTAHVVQALLQGSEVFGRQASRANKVAYLSEEPPSLFADRLRALGLGSDRLLVAFRHRARQPLPELLRQALDMGAEVVIVDTVAAWAGIEDENSATEVEKALRPVISLAQERGVSILLLHHLNKADGPEGTAHRGSGHLVAMVDIAVELRRPEGNAPETRRVLRALSRYQETPQELVIDLQEGGYDALGTGEQVIMRQAEEAQLDVLPGPAEEAIPFERARPDADTIMGRLGGSKLPRTTLQRVLASMVERGMVGRQGSGKRGDPYRYRLAGENLFPPNFHILMGGNKTGDR